MWHRSNRCRVAWTAPSSPGGAVVFHAAANAADFDESEDGGHLYPASATSRDR